MQDIQNIPNPDVNSTERDDDFGSHSDVEQESDRGDIENPHSDGDEERRRGDVEREDEAIPVPPDAQPAVPIEDPPDANNPPVGENENEPERIV